MGFGVEQLVHSALHLSALVAFSVWLQHSTSFWVFGNLHAHGWASAGSRSETRRPGMAHGSTGKFGNFLLLVLHLRLGLPSSVSPSLIFIPPCFYILPQYLELDIQWQCGKHM